MNTLTRHSGAFVLALLFTCAALAIPVSLASANAIHRFSSFGTSPVGGATGVAVDDSNGDIYTDSAAGEHGIVAKFDPSGGLVAGFASSGVLDGSTTSPGLFGASLRQLASDQSTGDLYVSDWRNHLVDKFDSDGNLVSSFANSFKAFGIAVSPSNGNVYLANTDGGAVVVYNSSGEFQHEFSTINGPVALAVAASGEVYVASGVQAVAYEPSGNPDAAFGAGTGLLDANHVFDIAVDPANGDIYADEGDQIARYDSSGHRIETIGSGQIGSSGGLAVGSGGTTYVSDGFNRIDVFGPLIHVPDVTIGSVENPGPTSATLTGEVGTGGGGSVTSCQFQYGVDITYGQTAACLDSANTEVGTPGNPITSATQVHADIAGLTAETTYHYVLVAAGPEGANEVVDHEYTPRAVAELETEAPTNLTPTSVTLNGSFVGNGEDTHYYFEWGSGGSFTNTTPAPPADAHSPTGPGRTEISAGLSNLEPATTYQYRVVAENTHGSSRGGIESFSTPPTVPSVTEFVSDVHSDSVVVHAKINPHGRETTYHVEYGPERCSVLLNSCTSTPDVEIGSGTVYREVSVQLSHLSPGTVYYYRVVAVNSVGTEGPERFFTTFPSGGVLSDPCPNAHVRQQTGAALLLDCRAYELVSAADTGGYNVESDLVPNGAPYPGFPEAENPPRVLYGVHAGGVPGTDHPTNRGLDPYVATRGSEGWSTAYVGIPATNPFSAAPFSSAPTGADASLETFAFGAPGGCSPCFEAGYTGIPVRLANGQLLQGMVPAPGFEPGPSATPDGFIAQSLSADGSHLIFGSTSRFAAGGNEGADVSIYDHNLKTGETHVVSNTPSTEDFPTPLPCLQGLGKCNSAEGDANGIAELAISSDGSRILIGQKVSEDADGNPLYHLYMDINDGVSTIDLTPGTTSGVLFDGMSADGSEVFFTSADKLLPADENESADLYQAEVSASATALQLISGGDSASCDPVSNSGGAHWNALGSSPDCGVLAIGGGRGVASQGGAVYLLSPELLDGVSNGTANQPNLYLAAPGSAPTFVATLDPNDPLVLDALKAPTSPKTGDFQLTPDGRYAAFASTLALHEGIDNAGHAEVYRYDASTEKLDCASCNPTNASATADSSMAADGLSLTADGRVFFDSKDALAPRDLDNKEDVYEWEPLGAGPEKALCEESSSSFDRASAGCLGLISTGTSPFASSLLGASADGTDVYFFTNDSLAPQDQNGPITKIYDARQEGGFPFTPPQPLCAASDECHGAGSPAPGPAQIRTLASGPGNAPTEKPKKCKKGFALKHGHCVKPHQGKKHRQQAAHNHPRGSK
jgi:hypothetical protein